MTHLLLKVFVMVMFKCKLDKQSKPSTNVVFKSRQKMEEGFQVNIFCVMVSQLVLSLEHITMFWI